MCVKFLFSQQKNILHFYMYLYYNKKRNETETQEKGKMEMHPFILIS